MNIIKTKFSSVAVSLGLMMILVFLFNGTVFATNAESQKSKKEIKLAESFPVRGFHIDLRVQVMTMPALKSFAKELADFGINTLVMEWEASYPYEKHATISNKYAYSREEVRDFIAYCENLGLDVIPLQQCFGHVEYILRHARYNALKESRQDISQVCPLKVEETKKLFTDLFADMISLHDSKYLHIGIDETRLLGHCPECSSKIAEEGTARLFGDYVNEMCNIVIGMGKIPVLWADIVLKYPEAIEMLPKEVIYVDWNYGWKINYFGDIEKVLDKGLNFWGAPAIRSHPDNWYTIDWKKHFNNQRDFIPYARKAGYQGMIMTSWSTSGVYGFNWDTNYEVLDMYAMRNVYPLSGFRILIAAYAQSLNQVEPLDPESFVIQYAQNQFDFTEQEGEDLWQVLKTSPDVINLNNPLGTVELETVCDDVNHAKKLIDSLTPKTNQKEFEHLRLMLDLRAFYLDFKKAEAFFNSNDYNLEQANTLLPELKRLLVDAEHLNERFSLLNAGYIQPEEIVEQNQLRTLKLRNLYKVVARQQ